MHRWMPAATAFRALAKAKRQGPLGNLDRFPVPARLGISGGQGVQGPGVAMRGQLRRPFRPRQRRPGRAN